MHKHGMLWLQDNRYLLSFLSFSRPNFTELKLPEVFFPSYIQVADIGRLNNELVSEKERLRKELEKAKSEPETMKKKRISSEKVRYCIIYNNLYAFK